MSGVILESKAPDVPCLSESMDAPQATNGPHRLVSEQTLNDVCPISLLPSGGLASDEFRIDVSREVEIVDYSRRRRQRNLAIRERHRDAKRDFQDSRPASVSEGVKLAAVQGRHAFNEEAVVDEMVATSDVFIASKAEEMIHDVALRCTTDLWLTNPQPGGRNCLAVATDRRSQKSSNRPLSLPQRSARMASAPATVQCMPARLHRTATAVLQPASTTPEPTQRLCARNSG